MKTKKIKNAIKFAAISLIAASMILSLILPILL